jgi:hypothetical protein
MQSEVHRGGCQQKVLFSQRPKLVKAASLAATALSTAASVLPSKLGQ